MNVSVIIPWQAGCPHREAALDWVLPKWSQVGEVVLGECAGPWVKARAVADGLSRATGDLLVIADADVWVDPTEAIAACTTWAIPHLLVHRLSKESTELVLAGADWRGLPLDPTAALRGNHTYRGMEGGGVLVIRRDVYEDCPIPPVVGWGQEDQAWAYALRRLHAPPERFRADLVHLWHPPQPRRSRSVGSDESARLLQRYQRANPQQMRRIVEEHKRGD